MSLHSYNKIWIHLIWEIPAFQKIVSPDSRKIISDFLNNYSKAKDIFMQINFVNADHIHALVDMPTNLSVEDCIRLYKGASSFYINKNRITRSKFSWEKGYGALSVSPSKLGIVTDYIRNQEEHHRKKSFKEEYELFLENYGIKFEENG